jgi:hypothetical protein
MHQSLPSLDHLLRLTDTIGIVQHAKGAVPDLDTGYCTDDVARAFIVACMRWRLEPSEKTEGLALGYLAFLRDAMLPDGRFRNFAGRDGAWLEDVGSADSNGRALWALGFGVARGSERIVAACGPLFERSVRCIDWLEFPHSETYAMLGLCEAVRSGANDKRAALAELATRSAARLHATSMPGWLWFEETMTYDNARFPQALIEAGALLDSVELSAAGAMALAFLESIVFEEGMFKPIGSDGWLTRGGARAYYAQQPLEAAAMVDAELAAGNDERAALAYAWFLGRNSAGIPLVTSAGECHDGLELDGRNENFGAESTLAFLAASHQLERHGISVNRTLDILESAAP